MRLGRKYTGDKAKRIYFPTREEAEEWLNGEEAKKLKADSTGIAQIYDTAKVAGVPREHLDPEEMRKALTAYRVAKDHGLSITEAVGMAIEKRCPSGQPRTLREACDEVIRDRKSFKRSDGHIKLMRGIYDRFCVRLGKRSIHEISYRELNEWRASCVDLSLRTLRSYFTYLAIVFKHGIKLEWCTKNPAADIKARIEETPGEVTIITANEMARLLGAAMHLRKEFVAPLALKAFAGLRTAELRRMRWAAIGESAIHIPPRHSKTRKARRIPHLKPLPAWLVAVKSQNKPSNESVVQMQEKPFHHGVAVLAKAAGVRLGANAIRHSFGTYHAHKNENYEQTALLMGNSVAVVERDYVHHNPADSDIEKWWRITPTLARKAYAHHVHSKKVGTAVAKKKRSKGARILFSEKKPAGKSGAGQSRKDGRSATAAKKGSRRKKTRR
jgi:integrase